MYFALQIISRRNKLNLTEATLADKIGVSRSYIALIEHGRRLPSKKLLAQFADALALSPRKLKQWYLEEIKEQLEL